MEKFKHKLIKRFNEKTELKEVEKNGFKSKMALGNKTIFRLEDIIRIIDETK
jgi:hypothetical protein